MSCWLLGCGVDASGQSGPDQPAQVAPAVPLCPSCTSLSGGETSDFGGGRENCFEQELPLSAAVRSELGVDAIISSLSEPFSSSLRYPPRDGAPSERPDTTLTVTTTLGTAGYFPIGKEETGACRDSVRIPVTVSAAASDGAFAVNAAGVLEVRRGDLYWQLIATTDLAQVDGDFDLEVDESRPHVGELSLGINGFPTGPRGYVSVKLYYPGEGGSVGTIPIEDEAPGSEIVLVGLGLFPDDHCTNISFPLDNDEHHDWLGGSTPRQVWDAARASVPTLSSARWRHGNATDMSVKLGELPASSEACLGATSRDALLFFDSSTRLQTEDGRVDAEIIGSRLDLDGTSGVTNILYLPKTLHSLPRSRAESEAGIEGLEGGGTDLLTVDFYLEYDWTDGVVSGGGIIDVIDEAAGRRADCLVWPEDVRYRDGDCLYYP